MEKGWKLFEYGLRTPADGRQKWQRALYKPFSHQQLPIWDGNLTTKSRLLILEEQAIGDVMMFASLIPLYIDKFESIGLLISDRLFAIYKRSFSHFVDSGVMKIYSKSTFKASPINPRDYDFQIPIGSLIQYFTSLLGKSSANKPVLCADPKLSEDLRQKYLSKFPMAKQIIVIRW